MNGHLFNKTQYKFFSEHLKKDLGKVKLSKSCQWIVDTHRLGYIDNGYWFYTEKERAAIIRLIKSQLHIDLLSDPYPEQQSRIQIATRNNAEKRNALAVSEDFVLVNALNTIHINNESLALTGLSSLGVYVNAQTIQSIQHQHIVLVENLSVMANLDKLVLQDNAKHLLNALWVYRGDLKAEQSTGRAYEFFRRFKETHQLICFADMDPKGLEISLTSTASYLLSPTVETLQDFSALGPDIDYFNQKRSVQYLLRQVPFLTESCQTVFNSIVQYRKTIKQEHMLAHQIPLSLFVLRDESNASSLTTE
jgi:hypothetical protein